MAKIRGIPDDVTLAEGLPVARICIRCERSLDDTYFDEGKKHCRDCLAEQEKDKSTEKMRAVAGQLLSQTSAGNLDEFIDEVFVNLGGEKAFAAQVADQITVAFTKRPGAATNIQYALQFMKLLGVRDKNRVERELKDLSYEELQLERARLAKEIFLEQMNDQEKVSFAKQILASTGQIVLPGTDDDSDDSEKLTVQAGTSSQTQPSD